MPITDNIHDIKRIDTIEATLQANIDNKSSLVDMAKNVITQGNIAIDATTVTKNFAAVTYTGNSTTQDVVTGISSVDFTVSANGSGFWLDRTTNQVKNDAGTVQASGDCVVNTSKVHVKDLDGTDWHTVVDGLRGRSKNIFTNGTTSELTSTVKVSGFTSDGFSVGINTATNTLNHDYIAYQTLYTHIKWGVTSQGKFQIEAYNPVTKEGMIYYLGSGLAGHEISHSQGVELDFVNIKPLETINSWTTSALTMLDGSGYLRMDTTSANDTINTEYAISLVGDTGVNVDEGIHYANISNEEHIMYYKCKSETFDILQRQTSSTADTPIYDDEGNYLFTADTGLGNDTWLFMIEKYNNKVIRVINKGVNVVSNWTTRDYARGLDKYIFLNTSGVETTLDQLLNPILSTTDSFFDLPTDDTNLNITASVANYTNGKDENGYVRSAEVVTASVDLAGVPDGFKWVAKVEGGSYNFYDKEPSVGLYYKESADDNRLVFSDGKYYSTTGGELVTNGTFDTDTTSWTASEATLSVESGRLKCVTTNNTINGGAFQAISVTAGEKYKFEYTLEADTDHAYFYISSGNAINLGGTSLYIHQVDAGTTETNTVDFTALETGDYYLNFLGRVNTTAGDIIYADNISVYKLEATLSTALTTPISLIPNPVMVQSETPMYIDYSRSLSENVMEDLETSGDITTHGEFIGKNACTAWVNFDGTTTPPTIRDSFNVSDVVRVSTGVYEVYFNQDMDDIEYCTVGSGEALSTGQVALSVAKTFASSNTANKVSISCGVNGSSTVAGAPLNSPNITVFLMGGKN